LTNVEYICWDARKREKLILKRRLESFATKKEARLFIFQEIHFLLFVDLGRAPRHSSLRRLRCKMSERLHPKRHGDRVSRGAQAPDSEDDGRAARHSGEARPPAAPRPSDSFAEHQSNDRRLSSSRSQNQPTNDEKHGSSAADGSVRPHGSTRGAAVLPQFQLELDAKTSFPKNILLDDADFMLKPDLDPYIPRDHLRAATLPVYKAKLSNLAANYRTATEILKALPDDFLKNYTFGPITKVGIGGIKKVPRGEKVVDAIPEEKNDSSIAFLHDLQGGRMVLKWRPGFPTPLSQLPDVYADFPRTVPQVLSSQPIPGEDMYTTPHLPFLHVLYGLDGFCHRTNSNIPRKSEPPRTAKIRVAVRRPMDRAMLQKFHDICMIDFLRRNPENIGFFVNKYHLGATAKRFKIQDYIEKQNAKTPEQLLQVLKEFIPAAATPFQDRDRKKEDSERAEPPTAEEVSGYDAIDMKMDIFDAVGDEYARPPVYMLSEIQYYTNGNVGKKIMDRYRQSRPELTDDEIRNLLVGDIRNLKFWGQHQLTQADDVGPGEVFPGARLSEQQLIQLESKPFDFMGGVIINGYRLVNGTNGRLELNVKVDLMMVVLASQTVGDLVQRNGNLGCQQPAASILGFVDDGDDDDDDGAKQEKKEAGAKNAQTSKPEATADEALEDGCTNPIKQKSHKLRAHPAGESMEEPATKKPLLNPQTPLTVTATAAGVNDNHRSSSGKISADTGGREERTTTTTPTVAMRNDTRKQVNPSSDAVAPPPPGSTLLRGINSRLAQYGDDENYIRSSGSPVPSRTGTPELPQQSGKKRAPTKTMAQVPPILAVPTETDSQNPYADAYADLDMDVDFDVDAVAAKYKSASNVSELVPSGGGRGAEKSKPGASRARNVLMDDDDDDDRNGGRGGGDKEGREVGRPYSKSSHVKSGIDVKASSSARPKNNPPDPNVETESQTTIPEKSAKKSPVSDVVPVRKSKKSSPDVSDDEGQDDDQDRGPMSRLPLKNPHGRVTEERPAPLPVVGVRSSKPSKTPLLIQHESGDEEERDGGGDGYNEMQRSNLQKRAPNSSSHREQEREGRHFNGSATSGGHDGGGKNRERDQSRSKEGDATAPRPANPRPEKPAVVRPLVEAIAAPKPRKNVPIQNIQRDRHSDLGDVEFELNEGGHSSDTSLSPPASPRRPTQSQRNHSRR